MNAISPFTALNIRAQCQAEGCTEAIIIGFREGATYGLLARYEFPAEWPNYELHWLTKDGRYSKDATSVYDLQVVR